MKLSKQHSNYVSEFSQFLQKLKKDNPGIEEGQATGRAIHWDKQPLTLEDQERNRAARISQQPYVYQNKP